ncbi:MAG: DUF1295 domain-containing protein [Ilumatobacteraceae bacterium]
MDTGHDPASHAGHGGTRNRRSALAAVAVLYAGVIAGAAFVLDACSGLHPLVAVLVADLFATLAVFAASMALRNSSLYDPYWSVIPPFIALAFASRQVGLPDGRLVLLVGAVSIWALRLTVNWARGWSGPAHEDWRYRMLRQRSSAPGWLIDLTAVHLYPTLQVYAGCLGMYAALALGDRPLSALDAVAAAVIVGAAVLQFAADEQMRAHRRTASTAPFRGGLWALSRHPNYFGEASMWWGVWLFGVAGHPAAWWWTAVGPLSMTALLRFGSVPMMDRRSIERRPGYEEIVRELPAMIPLGRRLRRR